MFFSRGDRCTLFPFTCRSGTILSRQTALNVVVVVVFFCMSGIPGAGAPDQCAAAIVVRWRRA